MNEKITIGEKLRDLRNILALTQVKFAQKLGINSANIASYENNINPLPTAIKWKIAEIIGVGVDYFDTNMSLEEALKKYKIDPTKEIKIKAHDESICKVFDSLDDFAKKKFAIQPYAMQNAILSRFFGLNEPSEYNFIVAKNCEPFAKNDELLVAINSTEIKANHLLIIKINNEVMLKFCQINHIEKKIRFTSPNNDFSDFSLSSDELKEIEILAYVIKIVKSCEFRM